MKSRAMFEGAESEERHTVSCLVVDICVAIPGVDGDGELVALRRVRFWRQRRKVRRREWGKDSCVCE